jgi:hypothetical protein
MAEENVLFLRGATPPPMPVHIRKSTLKKIKKTIRNIGKPYPRKLIGYKDSLSCDQPVKDRLSCDDSQ